MAYFNKIYAQEPGYSPLAKERWEEAENETIIALPFCLENAPISFYEKKMGGVKKTDKGMVIYIWFERKNENGEEEFLEWGRIVDKADEELFESYFKIREEHEQRVEGNK